MGHRRLFWRMAVFSTVSAAIAWILGGWAAFSHMQARHLDVFQERLLSHAVFSAHELTDALDEDGEALQAACERHAFYDGMRLIVIDRDGAVLADSMPTDSEHTVSPTSPEIQRALQGQAEADYRRTTPRAERQVYAAAPILADDTVIAVVRASQSAPNSPTGALLGILGSGAVAVALFVLTMGWAASRHSRREFRAVEEAVEAMGQGEFSRRVRVRRDSAFAPLAFRLHAMAHETSDRLRNAVQKRNQLEGVLASMVEGVLAVDVNDRIILMNEAAGRLFGLSHRQAQGRTLQEVVRHAELLRFFGKLQALPPADEDALLEEEVTIYGGGADRLLQVHGTLLRDGEGRIRGTLAALHDLTNMRRLESARRDFVANVSHELRTPITCIKGYVETLLEEGLADPTQVRSFLEIVARQSDRLMALVEDLLALSRIEQEEGEGLPLALGVVRGVLEGAYQACQDAATDKHIVVHIQCEEDLTIPMDQPLLQQAITNLLDNAIKYSEARTQVELEALTANGAAVIRVRDQGRGIEAEHLDRIFERFYRVDKARSRRLGGTGLGLAIVKHIVRAHGGAVNAHSVVGRGSVLTIHLPLTHASRSTAPS